MKKNNNEMDARLALQEKKEKVIKKISNILKDVGCTMLSKKSGGFMFIYYDSVEDKCYTKSVDNDIKSLEELSQKDLKKIYQDLSEDFL